MEREEVLSELLHTDLADNPNSLLLKKLVLTAHHGWLRVNGQAPDSQYSLTDYLLDDERFVIDYTRLSEQVRGQFLHWLLTPHREQAKMALLSGTKTNDYRGYTAEVGLSWWGLITNLLFYRKKSYHWQLAPLTLSLNYQLIGMEICQGKQGLLVGFDQAGFDQLLIRNRRDVNKYHAADDNQSKPLRNTKRLILTEEMVRKLITSDPEKINYESILRSSHPFSIGVKSYLKRMEAMHEYRQTQHLNFQKPWYLRLWHWFKRFFIAQIQPQPEQPSVAEEKTKQCIYSQDDLHVFEQGQNGEILVVEKRPELDSMVFCGGGAKIFAHVGAKHAFDEAGIKPVNFAGSSAGAIMATLCYLGYNSDEIMRFFQSIRQENLIHYEIDSSGLSDARAVKAGIDYMIAKKVNEIIECYGLNETDEGRLFLVNKVFQHGKITFESLHNLKRRCPDCPLGEKLVVTATNKVRRETRYLSHITRPGMEVSEAVKISASFPVVYKPSLLDGETYNDGGILSNLPTESFMDDHSTLLESEHGNCLSMVAFQFDNGVERTILDKLVERVYRENFIWNWIYSFLTGVKDPVSGWERDRIKLLQYSNQVVLISVGNVSATQFDIDLEAQRALFNNGYEASRNYINTRYSQKEDQAVNEEYMYSNFSSLEELLQFCCYRGRYDWFRRIASLPGLDADLVDYYYDHYFKPEPDKTSISNEPSEKSAPLFSTQLSAILERRSSALGTEHNLHLFEAMYPAFYQLSNLYLTNSQDVKLFKLARHSLSINNPLACLRYLNAMIGEQHLLLALFIAILRDGRPETMGKTCSRLNHFTAVLADQTRFNSLDYYGSWSFMPDQFDQLFHLLASGRSVEGIQWSLSTKVNTEPDSLVLIEEESDEDIDYSCTEEDRSFSSPRIC